MPKGIPKKLPSSIEERFWQRVLPEPNSGCWLWTGSISPNGYAVFWYRNKKNWTGHRYAYTSFKGPVPTGLDLDHKCRVRRCVNPDHLEPVTRLENLIRGDTKIGRSKRPHCPHGHEWNEKTTRINRDGSRHCRECFRLREAARRLTNRKEHP